MFQGTGGDLELVRRARGGDRKALSALYRRHLDAVYRYIYIRVGNRLDAEDLTSEVFFKMIESLDKYRGESPFINWLLGIARHTVLDFWRHRYRAEEVPLESFLDLLPAKSLSAPAPNPAQRAWLERILGALPDHYRRVLELRFLEGCSVAETARAMGISENYAKVLQYRALKKAAKEGERLKEER